MQIELLVFGPVILPLVGSALVLLLKVLPEPMSRPMQRTVVLMFLVASLFLLLMQFPFVNGGQSLSGIVGKWDGPLGVNWKQDAISWVASTLGLLLILFAWFYSLNRGPSNATFGVLLLVQSSGIIASLITNDLFNLFVCLEILGITSYIMIAMNKGDGAKLASLTYLLLSATSMLFYLVGLYGLYRLAGSLSLAEIGRVLHDTALSPSLAACLALIIAGVAMRSALLPLYGWLPEAHAQAPHAVSAILSGTMIKTPLFALTRILLEIPGSQTAGLPLAWTGALAAVVGSLIALSQTHIKRTLAYSTISQIGFVVSAWGSAIYLGSGHPDFPLLMSAALIYAFIHALYKSQLFMGLGLVTDTLGSYHLDKLRGGLSTHHHLRFLFVSLLFGYLTMAGLPGLGGHSGKTLLSFALNKDLKDLFILISGVLGGALAVKLSQPFWPQPQQAVLTEQGSSVRSSNGLALGVILVQGLLALALGLGIEPVVYFVLSILGSNQRPVLEIFSGESLVKSGASLLIGVVLFFLGTTKPGKSLLKMIRDRPRGFEGLFAAFLVGSLALSVWLLLAP